MCLAAAVCLLAKCVHAARPVRLLSSPACMCSQLVAMHSTQQFAYTELALSC